MARYVCGPCRNGNHCDGHVFWCCCTCCPGSHNLTPSADLPACRDEDPATPAVLAAAYPDPPEYQHPEDGHGNA